MCQESRLCGGQGDGDHPPGPGHVWVAKGGASGRGGALDAPRSWHVGSVGIGYPPGGRRMNDLLFILFTARASAMLLLFLSP